MLGDQFTNNYGITFTSPTGKVYFDPKSPFSNVLSAVRVGGPVEFPTWAIRGTLSSTSHSRFGISVNSPVTMTLKDKNNKIISNYYVSSPKFQTDGSYFYGEFAAEKQTLRASRSI